MIQGLQDEKISVNRWRALTIISIIQLILLLDATVVNVALPQIKHDYDLITDV